MNYLGLIEEAKQAGGNLELHGEKLADFWEWFNQTFPPTSEVLNWQAKAEAVQMTSNKMGGFTYSTVPSWMEPAA